MSIHCRHKSTEDSSILVYDTVCTGIYRVIQNDCRDFNNFSHTIHLR